MTKGKQQILFLAPQPFFQERGTPIAVRMALEALSKTDEYEIDLVTYHEGFNVEIPSVNHIRMWAPSWLRGIRPGISTKKLIADCFFYIKVIDCLLRKRYTAIHAVEESVFMVLPILWLARLFGKTPWKLIYDMDSSISQQIAEKWPVTNFLLPFFSWMESIAIKSCDAVLAVCDDLVSLANKHSSQNTIVTALYDVSLLSGQSEVTQENIRHTIHAPDNATICLYVGNLEKYQGIDLLINAFAILKTTLPDIKLVILGGSEYHIEVYANKTKSLRLENTVFLLGPRPLAQLGSYLSQATLLVSPRTHGNNTPMKVYSYLDSGVPLIATDLPTHTQVMSEHEAFLAKTTDSSFAECIICAIESKFLREQRAQNAKELVQRKYTKQVFEKTLQQFYFQTLSS